MPKIPALPFVRASVTQGLSANQSYRQYQTMAHEAGATGMRRQDYLRLYSQTRAIRGNTLTAMGLPKQNIPSTDHIIERDTQTARGYGQWVGIHQRTRGQSDYLFTPYLIKSRQPITPAEAEARAAAFLDMQPDEYDRVLLGIHYMGTEKFNPNPNR